MRFSTPAHPAEISSIRLKEIQLRESGQFIFLLPSKTFCKRSFCAIAVQTAHTPPHQSVLRIENEPVQRALGPGAMGGRILTQGELEEGVELHALTATHCIVYDQSPGTDIARPCERRARDPPGWGE